MDTETGHSLKKAPVVDLPGPHGERILRPQASIIIERVIFYILLALIVVAATPYGIVIPWRGVIETVIQCVVFALGILWMVEGWLSGVWVNRTHLLLLPLLALALFAYIQTISFGDSTSTELSVPAWQTISFDPYETRLVALRLLALTLVLGLLLKLLPIGGRLRFVVWLIIGIGVLSALFAILRQAAQQSAPGFIFPSVRLDKGYGQFINRNHFGYLMEMALGLILGLIAGGGVRRDRILLYLAAALPIWTALVLSNSRGALFSMICQLLLLALLFGAVRNHRRNSVESERRFPRLARLTASRVFRLALGGFLLTATLIGAIWIGGEPIASRLETISDEISVEASDSGWGVRRKEIWLATWEMIKEHPLTGVGMGGYWTAIPFYHDASGKMTPQEAHNDYLELLASGGLIGFLLGGWFVFLLIKFALAPLRSIDPFRRAACFGALVGLFGVAVHSLVDFGLHIPVNALVCLTLVAIATARGERDEISSVGDIPGVNRALKKN